MTSYWTGQTCDPFAPRESPCTIGNYHAYTVDAETIENIKTSVKFTKQHNIRLVVRNTGHDFWGRSTGHGALAVRVANLKDSAFLDWHDEGYYSGPAFKLGAGMMGMEAQQELESHGYVMVSGYCESVAPAGGYVQGAGHSPLSSVYGLAADQTLEYEVVTAEGELIKVTRNEHKDLFWALNGGGAGTWGVVISMTVRVYPQRPIAGAQLFIDTSIISAEKLWSAVDKFYSLIPSLNEQGTYTTYAFADTHFVLYPVSAYNKTSTELEGMLEPFTSYLAEQEIPALVQFNDADTYLEHTALNFAESMPMTEYPSGGRLIPRETLLNDTRRGSLVSVLRHIASQGMTISSSTMHPAQRTSNPTSAHPAWRTADTLVIINMPWQNGNKAANDAGVKKLTELSKLLLDAVPDSGSYSNEADAFMQDWKREMYGEHWHGLLEVKERYDPDGVFYSRNTPGADKWHVDASGRMCQGL